MRKNISITKSSWTEFNFIVDIHSANRHFYLNLSRGNGAFGTVEIGRIVVDKQKVNLPPPPRKVPKTKKVTRLPPMMKHPKKTVAVIVPYRIFGGAEVYLSNLLPSLNEEDLWDDFSALADKYCEDMYVPVFCSILCLYLSDCVFEYAPNIEEGKILMNEAISKALEIKRERDITKYRNK